MNSLSVDDIQALQSLQWKTVVVFLVINLVFCVVNVLILKHKEKSVLRYGKVQDRAIEAGYEMFCIMADVYARLNNATSIEESVQDANRIISQYRYAKLFLTIPICQIVETYFNQVIILKTSSDPEMQNKASVLIRQCLNQFKTEFHKVRQNFAARKHRWF